MVASAGAATAVNLVLAGLTLAPQILATGGSLALLAQDLVEKIKQPGGPTDADFAALKAERYRIADALHRVVEQDKGSSQG